MCHIRHTVPYHYPVVCRNFCGVTTDSIPDVYIGRIKIGGVFYLAEGDPGLYYATPHHEISADRVEFQETVQVNVGPCSQGICIEVHNEVRDWRPLLCNVLPRFIVSFNRNRRTIMDGYTVGLYHDIDITAIHGRIDMFYVPIHTPAQTVSLRVYNRRGKTCPVRRVSVNNNGGRLGMLVEVIPLECGRGCRDQLTV